MTQHHAIPRWTLHALQRVRERFGPPDENAWLAQQWARCHYAVLGAGVYHTYRTPDALLLVKEGCLVTVIRLDDDDEEEGGGAA